MATNPSFDPSLFNSGVSQAQWTEWTQDKRTPLLNRATAGVYAPGSTFKMAVAMAALEARSITPGDIVLLPRLSRSRRRAVPLLAQGRPRHARSAWRDRRTVATCSSTKWRSASGSTASPPWRTASVSAPNWRSICPARAPASSRRANGASARAIRGTSATPSSPGIGQGYIQVTPLQLATYAARVATGRKVEPHLTRKLGGALQPGSQPTDWPSLGLAERYLHVVREGMWAVVNEAGRHRAVGEAARSALADGRQDRFVAGAPRVARAARAGQLRQLQAALGIAAARAVRRLRAVRCAALRAVGRGGARQCRRRGGRRRSRATS